MIWIVPGASDVGRCPCAFFSTALAGELVAQFAISGVLAHDLIAQAAACGEKKFLTGVKCITLSVDKEHVG